jgi:single stranded DNA-binding protein
MMLNNCTFTARIATEPDLRTTPAGVPVCSFRVAVKRIARKGAEPQTDFFTVVCWNHNATFAGNYLTTGRLVSLVGSLQIRQWKKEITVGTQTVLVPMETPEIIVRDIHPLDKRPDTGVPMIDAHAAEDELEAACA